MEFIFGKKTIMSTELNTFVSLIVLNIKKSTESNGKLSITIYCISGGRCAN